MPARVRYGARAAPAPSAAAPRMNRRRLVGVRPMLLALLKLFSGVMSLSHVPFTFGLSHVFVVWGNVPIPDAPRPPLRRPCLSDLGVSGQPADPSPVAILEHVVVLIASRHVGRHVHRRRVPRV